MSVIAKTHIVGLLMALFAVVGPADADQLSTSATVFVREVRLEGPVLGVASVRSELLARYQDREVSAKELLQLAQDLTAHLVAEGLVNSGVILPDQKVENGIVYLRVIAGRVNQIVVNGNKHLIDRYITSRIDVTDDVPFNINSTVLRLQLLQRDRHIKKLNAELKPGIERGVALLNIDVEENPVFGVRVGVDNHLSPNVGTQQAVATIYDLSVFKLGDALTLDYRYAEGFSGGSATYDFPLNAYDTSLVANFDYNTSKIVSQPFVQLGIEGESQGYGLVLRQPLVDTLKTELAVSIGLQKEHVESFLLGEPFSFSASDTDGVSDVTVAQFGQEWVRRSSSRVVAIRSSFNVGIAALGASVGGEADGRFIEWLGQGEWLEKLSWLNSTIGAKAQLHLSNDTLPAFRKYALGGASSVRGYRENLITRDNGALISFEWTIPVTRWPVPWISDGQADGQLALIPFVDYGRGWDYLRELSALIDIASVGVEVQWRIGRNSSADLQLAKALISRESLTYDKVLQDYGVHFSVRVGF